MFQELKKWTIATLVAVPIVIYFAAFTVACILLMALFAQEYFRSDLRNYFVPMVACGFLLSQVARLVYKHMFEEKS